MSQCNRCHGPAYVGLNVVECETPGCVHGPPKSVTPARTPCIGAYIPRQPEPDGTDEEGPNGVLLPGTFRVYSVKVYPKALSGDELTEALREASESFFK